jgi:hypothetical protein
VMATEGEFDSMLTYARWSPQEVAGEVALHVRAQLSSVASGVDDPDEYAAEVDITATVDGDGVLITGTLNREPVADYLRDDFDPEDDVAANPLSVPSIEDTEGVR